MQAQAFSKTRNEKHIVMVNRVAELVLCIIKRYKLMIVQVYAPTTSYSGEGINNFYNDVDESLKKPNHYPIVMGDFSAHIGKRTNRMETATGKFGLELRNERGNTLVEWATSRKYKIRNVMFQKKAWRRWTWTNPNGGTKTKIDYILTNSSDIVTDVVVINQVHMGSHHRMVMINTKVEVEVKRENLTTKRPPRVDAAQVDSKKIEFQLELRNRFETLQELDDIDTMSETITDLIQQRFNKIAT